MSSYQDKVAKREQYFREAAEKGELTDSEQAYLLRLQAGRDMARSKMTMSRREARRKMGGVSMKKVYGYE